MKVVIQNRSQGFSMRTSLPLHYTTMYPEERDALSFVASFISVLYKVLVNAE